MYQELTSDSYEHTLGQLERLVTEAPGGVAADADRLIKELAVHTANPPVQPDSGCAVTVKGVCS